MATLADILRQTGYSQDGTLAAPATESPMTKAISEHIKTLPQQLATNQAALDSAIGSWNKTDFGTGQPNPNYRPEAIQELTQLMPNIGGLTAWHGTPHKIQGAFDISKVGTGEGAQAYGHGMYFAENPNVATEYRKALSGRTDMNLQPSDPAFIHAVESFREYGTPLEQIPAEMKKAYKSATDQDIKLAIQATEKGNLYKVDIPDEQIPNMLDWDKPLSQQSDVVRQALGLPEDKFAGFKVPATGTNYSFSPKMTGAEFYKELTDLAKTKANATEILNSMGVKGIRYLDQGSRTPGFSSLTPTQLESRIASLQTDIKSGAGNTQKMKDQLKGLQNELDSYKNMTSNFVVFDPSTVKILEENSKPVSRKALIEEQVNKLKD